MPFKLSKEAANDLENIWLYTLENWSIEQADRYFNLLMDEIEYLTEKPYSGKDSSRIRKGYFRSKVKSHFIFYKISKNADEIEIIRILHQRMDLEDRLNE
ncbi:type II toxin-antitoxin system RelE/ParE family toxin [Arachidicoccus ginsenosidivorans]|jgi:toxin ParE1/3/4|uniref:Toxin n=1 Tax=Arachidicoccus ginsenosidivorans TaxID=496057 RepID=A0A5B8VQS7_9BACT|nr:type II toxin-antitoxin system RelE/ParE family toxin [Arachidicoccus ginsenosidivorans]QEC73252.1 type II toxin-antitoxin system RelE/ParE family toxin [Arachidicoccus ginsenosidivorans]